MDDEGYAAVITESGWVFPIDVLTSDNYYIVNPHTVIGSVAVSKEDCERLLDKFGMKGASDENGERVVECDDNRGEQRTE